MNHDPLTKFLKIMDKTVSDSDLELINLGRSLGLDLISFEELRSSQDDNFADQIRKKALDKMKKDKENYLDNQESFYVGSVDFMVFDDPNGKKFFLLETNGGSHRGLSILTEKQQLILYNGYYKAIKQAIKLNRRKDNKIFILIGINVNDALIHEKVIMIEILRRKLKEQQYYVKIYKSDNYDRNCKADIVFLIADYKQISIHLSFSDSWIKYRDNKVSVLIGDGIARRFNNKNFSNLINQDYHKLNTIIVNPIYKITDDKSLTYLASYFSRETLEKYNLKYLLFTKALNQHDLINKLTNAIKSYNKNFIIKPHGGSGGAGVMPISKEDNRNNIKKVIRKSKKEFFNKFMDRRNPFPYTIQELANFSLIQWRGKKRTFDLRIYLAQDKGSITPIGGLARIARENYIGSLNKQEFVVNLSGYNGSIEVDRGCAISEKSSKLLNLKIDDYVNAFCIGCILFKSITENYLRIINFSNWDEIIN